MPIARVADIDIYYEREGNPAGPRLLVISGTGGDLRRRPGVFDWPLVDRFDVLAFDQRGLGQSSAPDVPYAMADYARDAVGLLDAVGWTECRLVGVSFGGMVAQEVALLAPNRISRLVLCCTSSGGVGKASYPLHELAPLPPAERLTRMIALIDTRHTAAWQAAHPAAVAAVQAAIGEQPPAGSAAAAGARRQLEARAGHDTYDRLPTLPMPVLVCAGRYDGIAPPANSEALAAAIPHARLRLFDGGHGFFAEDPTALPAIGDFLFA